MFTFGVYIYTYINYFVCIFLFPELFSRSLKEERDCFINMLLVYNIIFKNIFIA